MDNKKSSGYDGISTEIIKHISPPVFEPMRYIFNLSIEKAYGPSLPILSGVLPIS